MEGEEGEEDEEDLEGEDDDLEGNNARLLIEYMTRYTSPH